MTYVKIIICFLFQLFLVKFSVAQCYLAKSFEATSAIGSVTSMVKSIATDINGNIFTTGIITNGTFDFDPGPSSSSITVINNTTYVSKFDSVGNFVWVKFFGGSGSTIGPCWTNSLKIDASGNIYLAGSFGGTVDFDPGPGFSNLSYNGGSQDGFVCKLDNNGNFVWVKTFGSSGLVVSNSVTLDLVGNIIIAGYFQGVTDFDPGATVFNLTSTGLEDIFILKLDSFGDFIWAKSIGGVNSDKANSISSDPAGNVISTGYFQGTADFDPGSGVTNIVSAGSWDVYINKLDSYGNFVFAKSLGGNQTESGNAICSDQNGNIGIVGSFNNTVDFDPGGAIFNLTGTAFNLKLDSNGNFLFANNVSGAKSANSIVSDFNGNFYMTGAFSTNIYIRKIDSNGNLLMMKQYLGNSSANKGDAIAIDSFGSIISSGHFNGQVDFNPDIGNSYLTSPLNPQNPNQSVTNIFIQKEFTNVPLPIITSNSSTYCNGDEIILSSTSALNYNWSNSNTSQSTIITTSGSYYVTTNSFCYATSLPFNITFNPLPPIPTISTSGEASYCQNLPFSITDTLSSSPAMNYFWSTGQNIQSIIITSGGTYTVSIEDNNGCQSSSSITINVIPIPNVIASNSGQICVGNNINLYASGGGTYLWSGPAGFSSSSQNPVRSNATIAMSGVYTVTVSSNGCTSTASTTVVVNSNASAPTISANGPTTFCQGENVVLTSNSTSGNTWSTGATTQSITVSNSGSYTVTVINENGCSATSIAKIINVIPISATPTITASGPLTFCQGNSVILNANYPNNNLHSISWFKNGTLIGYGQSITVTTSGTYYAEHEYIPQNGPPNYYCPSNSNSIIVNVLPLPNTPTITINGSINICIGGSVTLISSSATNNIWSNGETTPSITVGSSGNYSVKVTDGVCNSIISNPVTITTINPPITPTINVNGSLNLCRGQVVTLVSNLTDGILWSNGETTPYIHVYDAGNYSVSASNGVCPTLTSNPVFIAVNDPNVNISASGQLAENSPNTSITFTATISNTGANPTYQWYKNGLSVGSNSSTYSNNNWVNGEKIVCRVTSSSGCSVYSNDLFVWLAQETEDSWQRMADVGMDKNIVSKRFSGRIGGISFSIGDKIYFGLGYSGIICCGGYSEFYSDFWEYNTRTNEWTERSPFAFGNSPRVNAIAFEVNGKGYVGFGKDQSNNLYNDLWEYNPQNDTWTQKTNCPGLARHSAVATGVGFDGFIGTGAGFNTICNDWWKYSPLTDTWNQLSNYPISMFGNTCSAIGNKIYVIGGSNHEYDIEANEWNQIADIPITRLYGKSFVINKLLYIAGGQENLNDSQGYICEDSFTKKDLWQYNPQTNAWLQKSDMNLGNISNGSAESINGNGYYIGGGIMPACFSGGYSLYGSGSKEAVIEYNPTTDNWTTLAPFGAIKTNIGFSTTIGDKGYTLMAYNAEFIGTQESLINSPVEIFIFEYDASNNIWKQKSKYPGQGIRNVGGGFAINGKIYYGSGIANDLNYVNDFWEYNPMNDSWTLIGTLPIGVTKPFTFVLNGKGYMGGSQMGSNFFEFNPISYSWTQRASLPATPISEIFFTINNYGYTGALTSSTSGSLFKYDPNINIWTNQTSLPFIYSVFSNDGIPFSFSNGTKGYYGYADSLYSPPSSCTIQEYNPINNSWIQKSNLPKNGYNFSTFNFNDFSFVFAGNEILTSNALGYIVNDLWQYKASCSGSLPSNQVTLVDNELTADAVGAIYQWLDCDNNYNPIPGADSQSYQPIASGSYAVSISNGECSVTSLCTSLILTGFNSISNHGFNIFPNPTSSIINIETTGNYNISEIVIFDVLGRRLYSLDSINNSEIQIEMILKPGTYYLEIEDIEGNLSVHKVIKI
jgi:hypothetical protein